MAMLRVARKRKPLVLRPLPERRRSLAAGWSLRFAGFAPVLAIVSLVAHSLGVVDTPIFLILLQCAVGVALIGIVLVASAIRSLWLHGMKGGRRAIGALFLSLVTLLPFGLGAAAWITRPHQSDVATDTTTPPLFASEMTSAAGRTPALNDGYPLLTGRRFNAPPDAIEETILKTAEKQGWTLVARRGRIGADDELLFEFSYSIPALAIPGSVVLRLEDEGDTSFVDMRARTRFVTHDLGWNAALIERYLRALDYDLIGIVDV